MLRALGLETPFQTIESALVHLGYVQIDPLNICGRMHDLILRNRVRAYREGDLMRHLHGQDDASASAEEKRPPSATTRGAFEHHHPTTNILVAFPLGAWPHLLAAMQARSRRTGAWSGRLTPRERAMAPDLLQEIAARGPLGSEDFDDARRAHRAVWGTATLVKSTLQKLFFHGKLLIAQRSNHRRRYDLPERVLPPEILARPAAPASETARWLAHLKLRQRRLAVLTRDERTAIGSDAQAVVVENCPPLYCLTADLALLDACMAGSADPGRKTPAKTRAPAALSPSEAAPVPIRLLAPLDPLIYDRKVTAALWNFNYTWEAYTPPAKRVRGHYALPVLAGTELVGHVEPKANRSLGKLELASRAVRRGYSTGNALDELAAWLELRR